jgi:hypothetical protein
MTGIEELKERIRMTDWFSRIGQRDFAGRSDFIHLPSLEEWRNITGILPDEPVPILFEAGMTRLPTGRDEEDPIHRNTMKERAKALGKEKEFSREAMDVYKTTLNALSPFQGHQLLVVGPHDFTEGARGAALYAARQATYETLLGEPGFWCRAIDVFHSGHWPFGLMPDGRIVVL